MTPRSVEQTLEQQQRHRVEQQRRHHLVDAGDPLEPRRQQRPQQAGNGAGREGQREGEPGVEPGRVQPGNGGADRPGQELALGADVVVAGAEGDGDGEPGQQQRRGGQEDLLHAVRRRQRRDQVAPVGGGRVGATGADRNGRDEERGDDGKGHGDRRPPPRRARTQDQGSRGVDRSWPVISSPSARGGGFGARPARR